MTMTKTKTQIPGKGIAEDFAVTAGRIRIRLHVGARAVAPCSARLRKQYIALFDTSADVRKHKIAVRNLSAGLRMHKKHKKNTAAHLRNHKMAL